MKTIIFLALLGLSGCFYIPEDGTIPCGYEEQPYYEPPLYCEADPWSYEGECCTWIVQDYYSECRESWCYNNSTCGWVPNQRSCYPN